MFGRLANFSPLQAMGSASHMVRFWLMATYLIIALLETSNAVDTAVQQKFAPTDSHKIEDGKWLIASPSITSKEVADNLQIPDNASFIVTPIRGYYGRARSDIWEWLAAKSKVNV